MSRLKAARQCLSSEPDRAASFARQELAISPQSAEARFIVGAALRRQGDSAGALEHLSPLAIVLPRAWGVAFEDGMARAGLGDGAGAILALQRATVLNPGSPLAWHALADQLAMQGLTDDAIAAAKKCPEWIGDAGFDPNDIAWLRVRADAAARAGNDGEAERWLDRAIALAPDFWPALFHRAALLHRWQRDHEAQVTIERLVTELPHVSVVHALAGAVWMQLGETDRSVAEYRAATAIEPDSAPLWHGLGHALRVVGLQAEAVAAYRRAIACDAGFTEAWWSLANLKTWRFSDDDIAAMRNSLANQRLCSDARTWLHFALGKAMDDEGRFADAFDAFSAANALHRASHPHDRAAHSAFVSRTSVAWSADLFAKRAGAGSPSSDPIFVVGLPRSGSTLVEQILASHSMIDGASELPDITAIAAGLAVDGRYPELIPDLPLDDFAKLGADYLERTRSRRGMRPFFVDKFPGNYLHVGLIHLMLPNARIIDVRREPLACCWSLFTQGFASGQAYSSDLADLGHMFADYARLMAHFDMVLPGRVLRVSYEELVDDLEGQTRRILDHCALDYEHRCLRFFESRRAVRTASSEQVRRPLNRDGLDRWRPYRPWLGPLIDALGPYAATPND